MSSADPSDLSSVPLFASLSKPELAEVAGLFEVRNVAPGVRLVGEGATGFSFFVIRDGTLAVTVNGEEIATLGPGDFFGEMALLGAGRRAATVTTTSPACVLVLFGSDFRLLQENRTGTVCLSPGNAKSPRTRGGKDTWHTRLSHPGG